MSADRNIIPRKIVAIYLLVGGAWILFSDRILTALVQDRELFTRISIVKGWLYVAVTGLLLYWLIRRDMSLLIRSDEALRERNEELTMVEEELRQQLDEYAVSQHELEESHRQYAGLVNTIDGVVWELDVAAFRFTFVSDQSERILGYPAARWLAEPEFWQEHIHPDDRQWAVDFCMRETEELQDHEFEYRFQAADGRIVWLRDIVTVISEDNRPVTLRGVMIDITERRIVEDALRESEERYRQLSVELEQRVQERTVELEVANRELESFSYSVSHDLQAPLRHVEGYSRILSEEYGEVLGGEGKQYLERLQSASRRMSQLVDDMLKLSQVNRGEISRRKVNLSRLAQSIIQELKQAGPERRVLCTVADGIEVTGDPSLLRLALDNLLGNAWKYTRQRDSAAIEFGSMEQSGQWLYFVRDNGAGFDMAYADQLFVPFRRLHPADEFEGSGIGLATVQRIIHRHGGRIWAEGEVDRGATFYFTLP